VDGDAIFAFSKECMVMSHGSDAARDGVPKGEHPDDRCAGTLRAEGSVAHVDEGRAGPPRHWRPSQAGSSGPFPSDPARGTTATLS
jgi:hypothetical protein